MTDQTKTTQSFADKTKGSPKQFPTKTGMVAYFLQRSIRWFVLAVIFAMLVSAFDLVNPKIIGWTVDSVLGDKASDMPAVFNGWVESIGGTAFLREHLWYIALLVVGIALISAACRYLFNLFNSMGAERLVKTMRDRLFSHIEHLPFTWHQENRTGDIIQRCTSDVETIKNFLSQQLTGLFRVIILIVLAMYFMWTIHPLLTLVSAVFIPIIVGYSFFFHSRIGSAFEKADVEEGKLSNIAQENLTGVRVVRAFGREIYERERFEKQNHSYTLYWVNLMRILSSFWAVGDLFSGLQIMMVAVMGAVFCVRGSLSAGEYIAFISYNGMLTWPVRNLGRIISEMSKAGISIDRIRYIMNSEEEKDREGASEPPIDRDIEFSHVTYRYENGTNEVLDDVSFSIKAGTTVGILGGTGSGKSTLMYLLDRLYELPPEQGRITIGGVDINDIRSKWLRRNIGMVLQEPYLFSRTLEENIGIALEHADTRQVREAARIASLDETIQHFTQGYETYVGERGVTLSGGQKQRAAIAQMLIRRPPVMVFDDSLSAVDAETDAKIRHALKEHTGDSTVILIAHRITTLMNADNIIVLDKGRIVQQGTHEELIRQEGIYKRIYELQVNASTIGSEGPGTADAASQVLEASKGAVPDAELSDRTQPAEADGREADNGR